MKNFTRLFIICLICFGTNPSFAIVAKRGTAIEKYAELAKGINNVGRLIVTGGKKTSSCSSTLIGVDGDIGIVLTAGHCAELTPEESVKKCRHQTISFAPNKTDSDPKQMPVIGRIALGKYIESNVKLAFDLGIVFIDMKDANIQPSPKRIQVDPSKISPKSIVQVVGYGRTGEQEHEKTAPPQRRIMSTQAFRTQEHNRDLLLLDEAEIENLPMSIPVGDRPAEGDSGGPIIDAETDAIIGVVSHKSSTNNFYSEPLYPHAEWLMAQIKNAGRYFVFTPKKSGNMSDQSTWSGGRRPIQFKNAYGEINPIVEISNNTTLWLDDNLSIYAIKMGKKGGTLNLLEDQSVEVLRINAPTVIQSITSKTLTVDDVSIDTSADVSIQTQLRILHTLRIQKGTEIDMQKDNPTRGLTLVDKGNINVEGTLKTHHIQFLSSASSEQRDNGCLRVTGTLISHQPIHHVAQTIQGISSKPGRIVSDYLLDQQGLLSFNLDVSSPSSTPILTFDNTVNFNGGKVVVTLMQELPIGFEQILMTSKEIKETPNWKGLYFSNPFSDSEVEFTKTAEKLAIKIVPKIGGVSGTPPTDELLN